MTRPRPALDPELAFVETLLPPRPEIEPDTFHTVIREANKQRGSMFPMPEMGVVAWRDIEIESADGPLGLRIFAPVAERPDRPCLYWIHGGGYILNSAFDNEPYLPQLAEQLDCVIVSVDYRLAPENPYPAGLEDCYTGLQWTFANLSELGVDTARVAIGGASAGGGLCAALALLCKERGETRPMFQFLLCPMIDDREITGSSKFDSPIWDRTINAMAWRAYLGDGHRDRELPLHAAPARATTEELTGLPPAYIAVSTLDVFLDEDIEYARKLLDAGVPTELHIYPGGFHGFEIFLNQTRIGGSAFRMHGEALDRALNPAAAPAS